MRFEILGPVRVTGGQATQQVLTGIPGTILAVLLSSPNTSVSAQRLTQAVWGSQRPASAVASLHNHMSRLRRQVGSEAAARIRTVPSGYRVEVGEGELDTLDFLALCERGGRALRGGDWPAATGLLAGALALWQADPLDGMPVGPELESGVQALKEARLLAWERRIEADLRLGRHPDLVPELQGLVRQYPLREALHGQLMLALHRTGRRAEALESFRRLRDILVADLGVEPSTELQNLHSRILDAHPGLDAPTVPAPAQELTCAPVTPDVTPEEHPPRPSTRFQLPADLRTFTGRSLELAQILALAEQARTGQSTAAAWVCAVDGMAGVGKTSLAVHAAHRLRQQFPDGQLFLDLHGHTPGLEALSAEEALERLLRSLGVAPHLIPREVEQRAALYRGRLADTRTLLVLDNASDAVQIRQLIPAASGCLVIVTSRKHLTALDDAHTLTVDPLSQTQAHDLLRAAAGSDRVPDNDPFVPELMALCAGLPLALRIAAARLRHRRALRVQDLVVQLREQRQRLNHLKDENRSLVAVFDSSYTVLTDSQQHAYRRLALVPGPDVDSYAAANLLGTDVRSAQDLLETLLDHNLLQQNRAGRYCFHDLVRLHAVRVAATVTSDAAERECAQDRLLGFYQYTATAADRYLARHVRPERPLAQPVPAAFPDIAGRDQALAWMRGERDNLTAALALAVKHTGRTWPVQLAAALAPFLRTEGPLPQARALSRTAARMAGEEGDLLAQANALTEAARCGISTGDYAGALQEIDRALAVFRGLDSLQGEANALQVSSMARFMIGDGAAQSELLGQAIALYNLLGDRLGEANVLCDVAQMHHDMGNRTEALGSVLPALRIYQEVGHRTGEGNALFLLGRLQNSSALYPTAAESLERALSIFGGLGVRQGEGDTLCELGHTRMITGDYRAAAELFRQGLTLYQELGHANGLAYAQWDLGRVLLATGRHEEAARALEAVLRRFGELGNVQGQANSLHELGRARHAIGDLTAAHDLIEKALGLFRELRDRNGEASALTSSGELRISCNRPDQAAARLRQALRLAQEIHLPLTEARALEAMARCGTAGENQAAAIYRRIGAVPGTWQPYC
ncbi:AfsR/SARP family transcriptional regulator [Streptomyces sp. CBMA29]|uniref:AfsR/SARP family transcriptional regulator n=1 Tax=Streptomyces sp. CBMA29 TaxID=1896314 RepID=UPI001661D42E|nr:BTAD domain-containing putative transcriptional regulator [Streptomyces sp. CBMA29]MBD0740121.1 hypothetical protein [Streptomyces sp. CBMA29]